MKRIIISLSLMILVLGAAVFEIVYVSGKADGYRAEIAVIDRLLFENETKKALQKCSALEQQWDEDVKAVEMLLIHDYADDIGTGLSRMRAHLEQGNMDMYFSESTTVKKGLASIKGSEYPYFENIL